MTEAGREAPVHRRLPVLASASEGVALVGLATEASYGGRMSVRILAHAIRLVGEGRAPHLFMLHFNQLDVGENDRRVDQLIERLLTRGVRHALFDFAWTADIEARFSHAGIRMEVVPATRDETSRQADWSVDLPPIELIGSDVKAGIANVDLAIGQACSYQRPVEGDAFYEQGKTGHRGCSYCAGAMPAGRGGPGLVPMLLDRVTTYRRQMPDLKTIWVPFAESIFAELRTALDDSRETSLFHGIELAIQCRPDVVRHRKGEIEAVAAAASGAGTGLRIALVGFENFSPRELEILHRGVTHDDLVAAATTLGAWRDSPPLGLDVRACVPSFIVFNPWTRIEDIELTLREIRTHRLGNANLERLRISRDMPLYARLVESELLDDAPVPLEVHPNGYMGDVAYRFADARVAVASRGFAALKPSAMSDQVALLDAVVRAVRAAPDPVAIDWGAVLASFRGLRGVAFERDREEGRHNGVLVREVDRTLRAVGLELGFPPLKPAPQRRIPLAGSRMERVRVGSACNNRCARCIWTRRLDFVDPVVLPLAIDVAGAHVVLGGREPTERGDLVELISALRAAGASRVELESNARRLTVPRYVRSLEAAGLGGLHVKLFATTVEAWGEHTGVPGSFLQTLRALAIVTMAAPSVAVTALIHPTAQQGSRLDELVAFAGRLGIGSIRVVLRLANLDLLTLDALREQVRALPKTVVVEVEG